MNSFEKALLTALNVVHHDKDNKDELVEREMAKRLRYFAPKIMRGDDAEFIKQISSKFA